MLLITISFCVRVRILSACIYHCIICTVEGGEEHGSSFSPVGTEAREFYWPKCSVTWSCTYWYEACVPTNIITNSFNVF